MEAEEKKIEDIDKENDERAQRAWEELEAKEKGALGSYTRRFRFM